MRIPPALLAVAVACSMLVSFDASAEATQCGHPYPCDYRWVGPSGPFEVQPAERVKVGASDGVLLNGWIWRPNVPEGVTVPVILISTPYQPRGSQPSSPGSVGGIPGQEFVAEGYAVALFSVRGTGDSGGCFGFKSPIEQKDQAVIVKWLGARSWSNGRVGMIGLSYPGTTPVMAAIQNPQALKTIVIAGTILDEYNFLHTPQGAQFFEAQGVGPAFSAQYALLGGPQSGVFTPEQIATTPGRVCEEFAKVNTVVPLGNLTGDRDLEKYWTQRRFIDGVPQIEAATFVVHGFQDRWGSGHAFQDDWAWESLTSAPKRMLLGQWWHEWPNRNSIYPDYTFKNWKPRLTEWFDYWLKGWGESAPGLGEVEFQDSSGAWYHTDSWPPPLTAKDQGHSTPHGQGAGFTRRRDEVVYLTDGGIRAQPGDEAASFVSVTPAWRGGTDPNFATNARNWRMTSPCPDPTRLVYISDAVEAPVVLAGNPFAWLKIQSSAPGGLFELQLYDLGPDFSCDVPPQTSDAIRPLTEGAIDLQYHQSEDYQAHLFPVPGPAHVRVDLANLSERLELGHRLALVVSHGVYYRWSTREFFPLITMLGGGGVESSHLVLPLVRGSFGGAEPTLDYPPRPFLPKGAT